MIDNPSRGGQSSGLLTSIPVTPEWRRAVIDRLDEIGMSRSDLARAVNVSITTINMLLAGRQPASSHVPAIELAVSLPKQWTIPAPLALVVDPRVAEVAELRAARDGIDADIVRLEGVQSVVSERLAEAYHARAELDVQIRRIRGSHSAPRLSEEGLLKSTEETSLGNLPTLQESSKP